MEADEHASGNSGVFLIEEEGFDSKQAFLYSLSLRQGLSFMKMVPFGFDCRYNIIDGKSKFLAGMNWSCLFQGNCT